MEQGLSDPCFHSISVNQEALLIGLVLYNVFIEQVDFLTFWRIISEYLQV